MPFHHPNDVFSFAAGEDMIDVFHKIQSVGASVLALAVPPEPHRSPLFCSLLVLVECDEMGEAGGEGGSWQGFVDHTQGLVLRWWDGGSWLLEGHVELVFGVGGRRALLAELELEVEQVCGEGASSAPGVLQ